MDWSDSPGGWVCCSAWRLYKGRLYWIIARQGVKGAPVRVGACGPRP